MQTLSDKSENICQKMYSLQLNPFLKKVTATTLKLVIESRLNNSILFQILDPNSVKGSCQARRQYVRADKDMFGKKKS